MNHPTPTPTPPVTITRHRVDWEAGDLDLADITARRVLRLGPMVAAGCWYLNPRYTVSSPAPTAAFFHSVHDRRSAWLRTSRQILGNRGQKFLSRQAERGGRLSTLIDLTPESRAELSARQSTNPIPLPDLPKAQRREVLESGRLAKSLGFGGVLFIDGEEVAPHAWKALADEALDRKPDVPVRVTRRRVGGPNDNPRPRAAFADLPQLAKEGA